MLAAKLRLAGDLDLAAVAVRTPGFVGADLAALTQEAAAIAVRRIFAHLAAPDGTLLPEVRHIAVCARLLMNSPTVSGEHGGLQLPGGESAVLHDRQGLP